MRWKTAKTTKKSKSRPFLVLPLIEVDNSQEKSMRKKPTDLRLFTKTFVPKETPVNDENARPLTATLEKPQVLDIRLITKIDMSLVRKEFLCITNLCRLPIAVSKARRKPPIFNQRRHHSNTKPLILPSRGIRRQSRPGTSDDSWEDESSSSQTPTAVARRQDPAKKYKMIKQLATPVTPTKKQTKKTSQNDTNNNFNTYRVTKKRMIVPQPCNACGRPDQPERFHSHPETPAKPTKKMEEKIPVKNTVQKPVAIKYKSKIVEKKNCASPRKPSSSIGKALSSINRAPSSSGKIPSSPNKIPPSARKIPSSAGKLPPTSTLVKEESERSVSSGKGPRTVTCYICGREFGTMSLPLHEPKCLERWDRENLNLPPELRRKRPVKPEKALTREEYNNYAWESAQANLVPCKNCKRTFYPDRLVVHQRSCKSTQQQLLLQQPSNMSKFTKSGEATSSISSMASSTPTPQKGIVCNVCGRMFGTQSIKFHEPQCLKKWHLQNDHLPASKREPMYSALAQVPAEKKASPKKSPPSRESSSSSKRAPMFPCYLCGRLFSVNSIYIHEPQCLKKWKNENDKLPPYKRKPIPIKPDIKFTRDGKPDHQAMADASWRSHLDQLIPCKNCGRTFNPDRVCVHEKSCRGQTGSISRNVKIEVYH